MLYVIGKGDSMKVLTLGDHVADAIKPSTIASLEVKVRDDLRIALTLIKHAENLAQLMTFRGTGLTQLTSSDTSDFHYGTTATGVLLRPIDDHGTPLAVDGTNLNAVFSVAILAVGLSLKEATTR
jgi:hypothetical protein